MNKKLYGLIGYPLGHSFSKKYFDEKFSLEQLTDCTFINFPIESIAALPAIIAENNAVLKGLAVTIPYKQAVLALLDKQEIPEGLDACNCIAVKNGKLIGYNTDYVGFEKSFAPLLAPHHTHALVLGQGGASQAVIFALRRLGISYSIVSRTLHSNAVFTYTNLTPEIIQTHSVIINTTPVGMYPDLDSFPPIPYEAITDKHYCYDLVYRPTETMFLQKTKQQNAICKNGMDMLIYQAEENWRIWNA